LNQPYRLFRRPVSNTCQSSVLNVVGNGGTSWSHGQGRERDYIPGPQILMPDSGLSNGIFFPR
ncbi:hypothetical protein CBP29_15650, partial [Fischerella thermalis WC341]